MRPSTPLSAVTPASIGTIIACLPAVRDGIPDDSRPLSPTQRVLLTWLAQQLVRRGGSMRCCTAEVAVSVGVSRRTVLRAAHRLRARHLVSAVATRNHRGGSAALRWELGPALRAVLHLEEVAG